MPDVMAESVRGSVGAILYPQVLLVLSLAALHVAVESDPPMAEFADAAILLVFATVIGFVGHRQERDERPDAESIRISGLIVVGGLVVGALAAVYVAARHVAGETLPDAAFVLSIGWSVGAAAGAITGYYLVRLEASLRDQRDLAQRLNVLQRVLRHNLRNEMTVIGGASQSIRAVVDDSGVLAKLDVIDEHVERVARLSEQNATLTSIWQQAGGALVTLDAVLDEEVERFRERHPDVPLQTDLPDGVEVDAHPQVRLAFREAMENAVAHNDSVTVSLAVRNGDAETVTVEITDDGSGVPGGELEPIEAGEEEPLSHTTGLGLWMIYWLVEASGGDLDVETGASGTTLAMTFDLARG